MFLKLYFIALSIFLGLDALWLGLVAKNFYQKQIGFLMKESINWWAGISFYLMFVVALVFFVIAPAVDSGKMISALLLGAFFGFIAYATYDLTNLATIKDWPLLVTFVDMFWGMLVGGLVSVLTYLIYTKWFV